MSEQLTHIFDNSACLNKRQMKEYLNGTMNREECHALEHHITNCEFCSEALDGMLAHKEEALAAMEELNAGFIKEHFIAIGPQVHLNSMAPAGTVPTAIAPQKRASNRKAFYRVAGIAAALLIGFGLMWYFDFSKDENGARPLAAEKSLPGESSGSPAPASSQSTPANTAVPADVPQKGSVQAVPASEKAEGVRPEDMVAMKSAATGQETDAATDTAREVVVSNYKVPLVSKDVPGSNSAFSSGQIEKLSTRNTADMAQFPAGIHQDKSKKEEVSISAARTNSTPYIIDGVQVNEAKSRRAKAEDEAESAQRLYETGKYSTALASYKKQMNSGDKKTRQAASLMAARCYLGLGQKSNAQKLLQQLAEEGSGSEKRQARRLLRDLSGDEQ